MHNSKIRRLTQLGILTAIILILAFTPLGYIKLGPGLSVTILHIPVIIGACMMGPVDGMILGAVFGATSFAQCFGLEMFGTTLFSISPFATFITCMVPRVLFGLIAGLLFKAFSAGGAHKFAALITGALATLCHTALFMTTLCLFFYRTDFIQNLVGQLGVTNVFAFILAFIGIGAVFEIILAALVNAALIPVLKKALNR